MIHDPNAILAANKKFEIGSVVNVIDVENDALVCHGTVISIGDGVAVKVPENFYPPNPPPDVCDDSAYFRACEIEHQQQTGAKNAAR